MAATASAGRSVGLCRGGVQDRGDAPGDGDTRGAKGMRRVRAGRGKGPSGGFMARPSNGWQRSTKVDAHRQGRGSRTAQGLFRRLLGKDQRAAHCVERSAASCPPSSFASNAAPSLPPPADRRNSRAEPRPRSNSAVPVIYRSHSWKALPSPPSLTRPERRAKGGRARGLAQN
jgi:hypothetical protein